MAQKPYPKELEYEDMQPGVKASTVPNRPQRSLVSTVGRALTSLVKPSVTEEYGVGVNAEGQPELAVGQSKMPAILKYTPLGYNIAHKLAAQDLQKKTMGLQVQMQAQKMKQIAQALAPKVMVANGKLVAVDPTKPYDQMAKEVYDSKNGLEVQPMIDSLFGENGLLPDASPEEKAYIVSTAKTISANPQLDPNQALRELGDSVQSVFTRRSIALSQVAVRNSRPRTKLQLIGDMLQGDERARAIVQEDQRQKLELVTTAAKARGAAFGQARLYSLQKVMLPDGQTRFMTGFDILDAQNEGIQVTPIGALSARDIMMAQRLDSEVTPAIQGVKAAAKAYDNSSDRAIFARIIRENPLGGNDPNSWLGNVVDQALRSDLSADGRNLAIRLTRLNETLGTMRATLGLPATNSMVALTLGLVPGPGTPDASYAIKQLDQLEDIKERALAIPALSGVTGKKRINLTNKAPEGNRSGYSPEAQKLLKKYNIPVR